MTEQWSVVMSKASGAPLPLTNLCILNVWNDLNVLNGLNGTRTVTRADPCLPAPRA